VPPGDPLDTAPYPEHARPKARPSSAKKKQKSKKAPPETSAEGKENASSDAENREEPPDAADASKLTNVNMLAMYLCGNGAGGGKTNDKALFC
jgi:outer membrane biosynthesis protein TonB